MVLYIINRVNNFATKNMRFLVPFKSTCSEVGGPKFDLTLTRSWHQYQHVTWMKLHTVIYYPQNPLKCPKACCKMLEVEKRWISHEICLILWNLPDFTWNPPYFMKSTRFHVMSTWFHEICWLSWNPQTFMKFAGFHNERPFARNGNPNVLFVGLRCPPFWKIEICKKKKKKMVQRQIYEKSPKVGILLLTWKKLFCLLIKFLTKSF